MTGASKRSVNVSCSYNHLHNPCTCAVPLTQHSGVRRGARHCWGAALSYPGDGYVSHCRQSEAGSSPFTYELLACSQLSSLLHSCLIIYGKPALSEFLFVHLCLCKSCFLLEFQSRIFLLCHRPIFLLLGAPRSQRFSPEDASALHAFGVSLVPIQIPGSSQEGCKRLWAPPAPAVSVLSV